MNLIILKEISDFLRIDFDEFLKNPCIDKRDFLIIGFKKISLYNKSKIFKDNFENFLKNCFLKIYKLRRVSKIKTIIKNIIFEISYFVEINEINLQIDKFFENKKFKMPWNDKELIFAKYFCIRKFLSKNIFFV